MLYAFIFLLGLAVVPVLAFCFDNTPKTYIVRAKFGNSRPVELSFTTYEQAKELYEQLCADTRYSSVKLLAIIEP